MSGTIIKCGYPRSGNILVLHILKELQKLKGTYKPENLLLTLSHRILENISSQFQFKSYTVNSIFENKQFQLQLDINLAGQEPLFLKVPVDHSWIKGSTSLIHTHSLPEQIIDYPYHNEFVKFYILRDGRDAVNSLCFFKGIFDNPGPTKESVALRNYANTDIFAKRVLDWKNSILSFFRVEKYFTELRYEQIINDPVNSIQRIAKVLEIEVPDTFAANLWDNLKFRNLPYFWPINFRKGKIGDWRNHFTKKHVKIFKEIAGDVLIQLGYEKGYEWDINDQGSDFQVKVVNRRRIKEHFGNQQSFMELESEKIKFDFLKFTLRNLRLIIYGCGSFGKKIIEMLEPYVKIVDAVDSDKLKWGRIFLGKYKIIPPDELLNNYTTYDFILIASNYHEEIKERLLSIGLEEGNDFIDAYNKWINYLVKNEKATSDNLLVE